MTTDYLLGEVAWLGERLVEICKLFRYDAIERLCPAYSQLGQSQKAVKLASSLLDAACVEFVTLNTRLDDNRL